MTTLSRLMSPKASLPPRRSSQESLLAWLTRPCRLKRISSNSRQLITNSAASTLQVAAQRHLNLKIQKKFPKPKCTVSSQAKAPKRRERRSFVISADIVCRLLTWQPKSLKSSSKSRSQSRTKDSSMMDRRMFWTRAKLVREAVLRLLRRLTTLQRPTTSKFPASLTFPVGSSRKSVIMTILVLSREQETCWECIQTEATRCVRVWQTSFQLSPRNPTLQTSHSQRLKAH